MTQTVSPTELWDLSVDENLVPDGMFTAWDTYGTWQKRVLDHFGGARDRTLLDIGCGPLRFGAFILSELGEGRFVGVEPFGKYVKIARTLAKRLGDEGRVEIIQSKDFGFPLDLSVDFAMCHAVFTHLSSEQIEACLDRLAKVMKPGAPFVFTYNLSGTEKQVHRGRLYGEELPLVSVHLGGLEIFERFAERTGARLEPFDAIPHPGQSCSVLFFP